MKIRVLVADDEILARARIRQMLRPEADVEVVGESDNGQAALDFIREQHPDLLFLDVQMPKMSGLDVLRALAPDQRPAAIFVTACGQHALEAFEVHALDCLLKPFKPSRFREALQRAREHLQARQMNQANATSKPGTPTTEASLRTSHITIRTGQRTVFIKVEEIEYVEAAANYAILHVGRESHVLRETLSNLEDKLPADRFLRVSRSAIVNLNLVSEVRRDARRERMVVLRGGKELPVTGSVREIRRRLEHL